MRATYAHEAQVRLAPGADPRAVGAAITTELCGHWEHRGPCRWPHHTAVEPAGSVVVIRSVFACEPGEESEVRVRVAAAMRAGSLAADGRTNAWTLLRDSVSSVRESEADLAIRLAASPG